MAEKLLPFGYDVFTIDIQWYEPAAQSYELQHARRCRRWTAMGG